MKRTLRIGIATAGALIAALPGCGSTVTVPALTPAEAESFRAAGNYLDANYHLEPGDTVRIAFPFHGEMGHEETIRPDGRITMPEVGEIDAGGLTTAGLEELLVARTSSFLREPQARVTVIGFAEKSVFVTGEVQRPGFIPYRMNLTPLQAIAESGGFLESASVESVVLIRAGGPAEQFISRKLDLQETITAGAEQPLELAPRDMLYVPRTAIADADIWVDQYVTRMFPFIRGTSVKTPFGF
jgi:protein involved in polysaccharide export with SLBB domain